MADGSKKTIPSISLESQLLIKRLQAAKLGDLITYEELSETAGRDVRPGGRGYGCLMTARERVLKDDQMFFAPIIGKGLKLCDDSERIEAASVTPKRIRRACKRGIRIATSVRNFDGLTKDQKVAHNTTVSLLGAFVSMATESKMKALVVGQHCVDYFDASISNSSIVHG